MKYRKASYNIRIHGEGGREELKPVDGYVFTHEGLRFGVTNRNIKGEALRCWNVTELTTGMLGAAVPRETRKKTVEDFLETGKGKWDTLTTIVGKYLEQSADSNPQITFDNAKTPVNNTVKRHSQTFKKGNLDIRHI